MNLKKAKPIEGQESVWDYPRPPMVESFAGHLRIDLGGKTIVSTNRALRLLETSHPPTYYIPIADFEQGCLLATAKTSFCEFKGMARYYDVIMGVKKATQGAWSYPNPAKGYEELKHHVAVYAHMMDACYVNDEQVQAQEGDFYGGWITSNIVGPFKGGPGTWGW